MHIYILINACIYSRICIYTDHLAAARGHTPVADGAQQGDGPRARGHMRATVSIALCIYCI